MRTSARYAPFCLLAAFALAVPTSAEEPAAQVSAADTGPQTNAATWECTAGHKIEKRRITLDSGTSRYTFLASGCVDPSHGDERPCSEGNFGMPDPTVANWYWGGFLQVLVNGKNATAYRISDMRVIETGARGAFQIVWAHPDAEVGLRLLMLPGGNHVLADLVWNPTPGASPKTVAVRLTCYPSFFTASRHRAGARHCQTPRTDLPQPQVLELVSAEDTWLYYYDTTFDVAKGEGGGPCAALVAPAGVAGGRVQIGDYAETTDLTLTPEAGEARLAFYDFTGRTNAEAEAYLKQHAGGDLKELTATDFRPAPGRTLQVETLRSEAEKLLADAGDDAQTFQPKVEDLLTRVEALKGQADARDWKAEGDLASLLANSSDLFWKLRAFAALNAP